MNPSNQVPEHLSSIPAFMHDPHQFSIFAPQPNSSPNPNLYPNPSSNSESNPNLNHLLSLSVPRKRRRGRPRSTTSSVPSQTQVFNIPSFSNGTVTGGNELGSSSSSSLAAFAEPNVENPNSSTPSVPDVSDEIIVINREATGEALIALTAGFPADSLTDEEIDAGVISVIGGIEQVNYILIRNHIITKWRENVMNWVTKDMFVDVIPAHCNTLLDSAYNLLVSHGYINFGVTSAIKEKILAEPSKPNVVVIGAGLAGLAAARQLMAFGFKVTVLEGRKRAGGRVYTKKMEGANKSAAADLGGSVLTGTLGNPLGIVARQLSSSLHKVRDKCPLYKLDGKPVDPDMDTKVETAFNRLLDKASRLRQLMGDVSVDVSLGAALETFWQVYGDAVNAEEMNLFNWHLANLEYANAGLLSKLSLAFWDQDDPYDMGGDHCFLPGGNGRLVQALAENVPIIYEKTVHTIRYGIDGVQVIAGSQVFDGDMVLCTVPLGVLKSGSIKFIPELPQRKLDGIRRLGFGLLNKVAMLFPHVFWETDLDTFGHLSEDPNRRGEFFLFYSYATVAGGPLLIALVAGEAAHKFETMSPTDAVTEVLQILKGIYEPQGINVPKPIQTVCTRWGSDPFSLGSYSNVAVGASGDDYDILAESVGDGRLFFAGEATTRRYPATMHGAFVTGLREAANMAHYANVRASKIKVERSPSKNAHSCASLLADLFRDPDLEFGSFSVIFGRKNSDSKSTAILRVAFSGPRKKSHDGSKPDQQHSNKLLFQQLQSHFNQQQELHVYTLLSRQQALELREVRGGDEKRLNYLCEKLGVKLVGRKGLGPAADAVIASIKTERGNRKPTATSLALKSGILKQKTSTLKQKLVRRAKVVRNVSLETRAKIAANNNFSASSSNVNTDSSPSLGVAPPSNGNIAHCLNENVVPLINASTNMNMVAPTNEGLARDSDGITVPPPNADLLLHPILNVAPLNLDMAPLAPPIINKGAPNADGVSTTCLNLANVKLAE
ncbi:protein FLOWERING LOCUS D [Malania oleifera]|uniref:protein FLOWERING LOCUS D n=1 Tax=Malania oleifera TaxID=397392 RepID=UPI0025AD9DE2|nr:protein FLOWERING LOCUS D [Malania oleifera]XP_057979209.1 protein FLOWERING LOCUS D [Malania oleifera]